MSTRKNTKPGGSGANLALAVAMRGKATGAGIHGDRRTKRNRTRSAQRRAAVTAGW